MSERFVVTKTGELVEGRFAAADALVKAGEAPLGSADKAKLRGFVESSLPIAPGVVPGFKTLVKVA